MSDIEEVLSRKFACLGCSTVMEARELMTCGSLPWNRSTFCPHCNSFDLLPADGEIRSTPEYFGPIGTKH